MALEFDTHIQYLKGVGPKLGDVLRKRGVGTVGELLEWFPRAYEDRRSVRQIASLESGQVVSLKASVVSVKSIPLGRTRRKIYEVIVSDSSGRIPCKFFRVPYKGYFERFQPFQSVRVSGKVIEYRGRLEFHHPDLHAIDEESDQELSDVLIPLYTETEGLSPFKIRQLMERALDELVEKQKVIPEVFPGWLRQKYDLLSRAESLRLIHRPPPEKAGEYLNFRAPAQRRIIFEEFFWMELHMAKQRLGLKKDTAPAFHTNGELLKKFESALPFQLTGAQKRVMDEILADLKEPHPMHRLVQGDVGSGKTLVALMACLVAIENKHQAALMVPTEILAEQHFRNAEKLLKPLGIRTGLLVGNLTAKEHRQVLEDLRAGEIDLCIGTHALIEDDVQFQNLGLVVIDEQHRFGVEQRQKLRKNITPHFLVMTATPIPRTLAMTVYGDLDVSVVDELPPGRSPIVTRKAFSRQRFQVFEFMKQQIAKCRQAYVIYPLVEESEKIDLKDAISEYEKLKTEMPEIRFGLLHGKMKGEEKDEIMSAFRRGEIQVLVSTTVIEVGVDVPNANTIIIEHAERFGLSQLHQLRGRVGRGSHKSFCILLLGYALSEEAVKRAEIIESTTDGFKISEADLELRGPGEFLGRKQSGLPGFKMAHLVRDLPILQEARQAAVEILRRDPDLTQQEHAQLRTELLKHEKAVVG